MQSKQFEVLYKSGLTDAQKASRVNYLGGSDANIIMAGNPARVHGLWCNKTGREEPDPTIFEDILPVQMGAHTESLNRDWYRKQLDRPITQVGDEVICDRDGLEFMRATLDGMTVTELGEPAVFEAKHVNGFSKYDDIRNRYMPQLQHNMFVTRVNHAVLSVFLGNGIPDPWYMDVEFDEFYFSDLVQREINFWNHVQMDLAPDNYVPQEEPDLDDMPTEIISMEGNNAWADLAADLVAADEHRKIFDASATAIKKLIPATAKAAYGYGVRVTRNKNNSKILKVEG